MNNSDFFHGAVLSRIIDNKSVGLGKYITSNSSYIVDDKIVIYIKYSQKRISPWTFSFSKVHIEELKKIKEDKSSLFIILLCNDDGICCLNFQEFSNIISIENENFPKWIKAQRQHGEKYAVSGSDGDLKYKIGNSDFPQKIYE